MAEFYNWNKSVVSYPAEVLRADTVGELRKVVKDSDIYPRPVRVAGHLHSMTACFATNGTQVFLEGDGFERLQMNGDGTLTVGGGVTMFQIASYLRQRKLQLAVMPEIGNATAGSVACCGTKDSSFNIGESKGPSQISSTVVAVKMVKADGTIESVDARKNGAEAKRMRLIRSSYGLLGIIYEVTFKTEPLTFARYTYEIVELTPSLPSLEQIRGGANSVLGFMQPYEKQILVERRTLVNPPNTTDDPPLSIDELARSKARRAIWKYKAATLAEITHSGAAWKTSLASRLSTIGFSDVATMLNSLVSSNRQVVNETMASMLKGLLNSFRASRADCMIEFSNDKPYFDFTFWAFPVSKWQKIVPEYLKFVHDYRDKTGFQKSLFTEVYLISRDDASFLTFSPNEDIFTLDMVHQEANDDLWKKMNQQFNAFAAERGGLPLLNQTKELTTQVNGQSVVRATLGGRWQEFLDTVREEDPDGRFMNDFFKNL